MLLHLILIICQASKHSDVSVLPPQNSNLPDHVSIISRGLSLLVQIFKYRDVEASHVDCPYKSNRDVLLIPQLGSGPKDRVGLQGGEEEEDAEKINVRHSLDATN